MPLKTLARGLGFTGFAQEAIFGGQFTGAPGVGATFAAMRGMGNIYAVAGNPVGANAADTTDDVLGGIALDATLLRVANQMLQITAGGTTGATTNNKRFKLFLNPTMTGQTVTNGVISGGHVTAGTPLVDSGAWVNGTTPNNAAGWVIEAALIKYGAAGSNTQIGQGWAATGTLNGGVQAGQALTLAENAIINLVITGSSYTTGAVSDVLLQYLFVTGAN